jgi:NADPH:quinone reductase-like Zn-dependent oxidoreductase
MEGGTVKAVLVSKFGAPDVLQVVDVPKPQPGPSQVLVRVKAAGVGPWDAWIREGKSALPQPLPLVPGSDISGIVEGTGPAAGAFRPRDEVYGVTNRRFTGGYAEYALAEAGMIAPKPRTLDHVQAASVPVVAVTAWQMLFEHANLSAGDSCLVHGAAGNVGAYAVQLARRNGITVIATASANDAGYLRELGADQVIDHRATRFETVAKGVDAVIDLVGGETADRSYGVLKPGGVLVSAVVFEPSQEKARRHGVRAVFMLVDVTSERLARITELLDRGALATSVGSVLPLEHALTAHRMLGGAPHERGKIVLKVGD